MMDVVEVHPQAVVTALLVEVALSPLLVAVTILRERMTAARGITIGVTATVPEALMIEIVK